MNNLSARDILRNYHKIFFSCFSEDGSEIELTPTARIALSCLCSSLLYMQATSNVLGQLVTNPISRSCQHLLQDASNLFQICRTIGNKQRERIAIDIGVMDMLVATCTCRCVLTTCALLRVSVN